MKRKQPVCFIIAGPNGAGKTTFAQEFLPREAECPVFVNADLRKTSLAGYSRKVMKTIMAHRGSKWAKTS